MRTIHLLKGTIMFKNPWIQLAIVLIFKMTAFYLIRKAVEKEVVRVADKNPDLAKKFYKK